MKIVITGGAGFIGTKICNKLIKNHEVIVFDNFSEQIHGNSQPIKIDGVEYIIGDVTVKEDWELIFSKNPEIIIHLASETGTGQSMDEIFKYVNTNIVGTSLLLEFLNKKKHKVKKLILSSTRAVYGNNENSIENFKKEPKSVYGVTKLTQENLFNTSCPVPFTILRFQNVYGDGQSLNNPYTGIITIFSKLFQKNDQVTIFDNDLATRDFIYVDDVVEITEICMVNKKTNNQTYDIGTGKNIKISEVANKLKNLLYSDSEIIVSNFHRKGDVLNAKADTKKIKNHIGWTYKTEIDDGLKKFTNWFNKKYKNSETKNSNKIG